MQRRRGEDYATLENLEQQALPVPPPQSLDLDAAIDTESEQQQANRKDGRRRLANHPLHLLQRIGSYFFTSPTISRLGRCGCQCLGILLLLVLGIVIFVQEGHHLTCKFHGALCTPFREYVNRFPTLPQRPTNTVITKQTTMSCARFEEILHQYHPELQDTTKERRPRILVLIGESRGGSTYTYDTLNLHPDIDMVGGEALFGFSNNVCHNNLLLRNQKDCTFENWLKTLYENAYAKRQTSTKAVVGTKINLEQIPPEFYPELAEYLACLGTSQTTVLHVTRAGTIASFLNYQMEVPERIEAKNFDLSGTSVAKGLGRPLELDPQLAAEWVHARDQLSQDLFWTLAFGAPKPLLYQRVYYEHLKDPVIGDVYWKSVFAFLGVDSSVSVQDLRKAEDRRKDVRTQAKTHGDSSCSQRISNWEEVKAALGPESLSSLVCEHHSR